MDKKKLARAIATGINNLGWSPDIPDEKGEMKFSPNCHEVQTILLEILNSVRKKKKA